jgi:O-antigen/teichoic acid export membrane protein
MTRTGEPPACRDGGGLVRGERLGTTRNWTNAAWLFAGNAVYALGQWLTLVSIARFGGPEMAGEYGLGLAITAPVVLLAGLALRTVQATDAAHRFSFGDYLGLRLASMAGALAAIAGVAAFLPGAVTAVVILVGLAKCCDGIGDIFHGEFQRSERMAPIGISLAANGILTFLIVTIVLSRQRDLADALWGSVAASVTASILYCAIAVRRSRPEGDEALVPMPSRPPRAAIMLSLGRFALPLGMASGLTSMNANVPRYVLEAHHGLGALGFFTAIGYIVLALNMVVAAVAQAFMPVFSRAYVRHGARALRRTVLHLVFACVGLGGLLTVIGFLAGQPLLAALYGPEFREQRPTLLWMLASAGFAAAIWFVDAALAACRQFTKQFAISGLGFGVVALTAWPLVAVFGAVGAAIALVVSSAVQLAAKLWTLVESA